jgi:hypothetical protein
MLDSVFYFNTIFRNLSLRLISVLNALVNHGLCTLLDPIIISDTMSSIYSDVLNLPSEISDHDAAVAYIECPNCSMSSY